MVSPTVVRKVKQDKVKKIVSKANRPETVTSSGLEQGASKYKDPWKPVDANFLSLVSKFGTIRENLAMDVSVSRPKKLFNAQSSRTNLPQAGKENVQPLMMRINQGADLEVVHSHHDQNFKMNAHLSGPKKLVQIPSSRSTSLTQPARESTRAHVMRSKQAELGAVQHRSGLNFEMNAPLSSRKELVRGPNSNSPSLTQPDSESARDHLMRSKQAELEVLQNCPGQNFEMNAPLSSQKKLVRVPNSKSKQAGSSEVTNTQTAPVSEIGITGPSKPPKKKRGRTKGYKLAKTFREPFEIIFPQHVNRPVGENSTMFTTEIGVLVRQFAPLQAESWGAISQETKDSIMDRLREKFLFGHEDEVIKSVNCTMAKRYYTWRYNIHDEFLKYRTLAAALSNPPPMNITVEDWMYLCNLFSSHKFKAKSERNKQNREKLKSAHLAGTKAYSKIRYDKRNPTTQVELGFVELYEATHQKDDGSWVDENARTYHEKLKEHKAKADLEGTKLTDEQLSVLTFGRKPGYVSGLGYGPKTTSSIKGKRTRADIEKEAYEAVKRAEVAEKAALEARLETAALAEKLKFVEAQQAEFSTKIREEMYSEMHSQFALFREQLLRS